MKQENRTSDKRRTTLITLILTMTLLSITTLFLISYFYKVKNSHSDYTVVKESEQTDLIKEESEIINLESETLTNSVMEVSNDQYTGIIGNSDLIEREFTVNDQLFYMMKTSQTPEIDDISAEKAAEVCLEALNEYFPNAIGKYPFQISLYTTHGQGEYHMTDPSTIWLIIIQDESKKPYCDIVTINPKTGKVIYIYCPVGKPYPYRDDYNEPCLSMQSFYNLTKDSTWHSNGIKYIRKYILDDDEDIIRSDGEMGIQHNNLGEVTAAYYIGNKDSTRKIQIHMDFLTQELVGIFFYNNI